MRTHELKIDTNFLDAILSGEKTFEIRKNDRGFQKGDRVIFKKLEEDGHHHVFSDIATADITYVLTGWGIEAGFCVFGIANVKGEDEPEKPEPALKPFHVENHPAITIMPERHHLEVRVSGNMPEAIREEVDKMLAEFVERTAKREDVASVKRTSTEVMENGRA
jgi:hypothetical protein